MEAEHLTTFDISRGMHRQRLSIQFGLWQREQVVKEIRVASKQGFVHAKERVLSLKDNLQQYISVIPHVEASGISQIHPRTINLDV